MIIKRFFEHNYRTLRSPSSDAGTFGLPGHLLMPLPTLDGDQGGLGNVMENCNPPDLSNLIDLPIPSWPAGPESKFKGSHTRIQNTCKRPFIAYDDTIKALWIKNGFSDYIQCLLGENGKLMALNPEGVYAECCPINTSQLPYRKMCELLAPRTKWDPIASRIMYVGLRPADLIALKGLKAWVAEPKNEAQRVRVQLVGIAKSYCAGVYTVETRESDALKILITHEEKETPL